MEILITILAFLCSPIILSGQPVSVSDQFEWPSRIQDRTLDEKYEQQLVDKWEFNRDFIISKGKSSYLPAFDIVGETLVGAQKCVQKKDFYTAGEILDAAIRKISRMGSDWVYRGYIGYLIYIDSAIEFEKGHINDSIIKAYCAATLMQYALFDNAEFELPKFGPRIQEFIEQWSPDDVLLRWVFYNYRLYLPDVSRKPDTPKDTIKQTIAYFDSFTYYLTRIGRKPDLIGYRKSLETYLSYCKGIDEFLVVEVDKKDKELRQITISALEKSMLQAKYFEGDECRIVAILDQNKAIDYLDHYYGVSLLAP